MTLHHLCTVFSLWHLDLEVRKNHSLAVINRLVDGFSAFLRACSVFRDACHEGIGVIFLFLRALLLYSLNLIVKLSDELQLIFVDLVLLLQLVILKLESADGDLEQLVLAFTVHGTILVKLVLALLILVLLLPRLDLLTKLLFGLL